MKRATSDGRPCLYLDSTGRLAHEASAQTKVRGEEAGRFFSPYYLLRTGTSIRVVYNGYYWLSGTVTVTDVLDELPLASVQVLVIV